MPTIPMIALKPCVYAGRRMAAGTTFEARGSGDARTLHAVGLANYAPAHQVAAVLAPTPAVASKAAAPDHAIEPAVPAEVPAPDRDEHAQQTLNTDHAVDPDADDISPRTGKPTRTYRRRDMTAEGSKD